MTGCRHRVVVAASEFGWGSVGKLNLVLEELDDVDVIVLGSGHQAMLDGSRRASLEVPQSAAAMRSLVECGGVDAALVVGDPQIAKHLVEAGCPTVFLDSLPFLWTAEDPVAVDVDTNCAQRCVPDPSWGVINQARRLVWVDSVVPSGRDQEWARSTSRAGVVVNVGGLHSPYSGRTGHLYLRAVLPGVLSALRDHGLAVSAICGNFDEADRSWMARLAPDVLRIGAAAPKIFQAWVDEAQLLVTSPGSTTLLQANSSRTPVITLPPQNLSQWVNAEWFSLETPWTATWWPGHVVNRAAFREARAWTEEAAVRILYKGISDAADSLHASDDIADQLKAALVQRDDIPTSRAQVHRLGERGAGQVAAEVRRLMVRGRERVLRDRQPDLRIYVGGPFQARLVEGGGMRVGDAFRSLYEELIDALEDRGWRVANAHRREAWGAQMMSADTLTATDLADIRACDVMVVTPGTLPPSPGTHVELGWASALGKKIIVLAEEGHEYAALVRGLPAVADATVMSFVLGRPVADRVVAEIEKSIAPSFKPVSG